VALKISVVPLPVLGNLSYLYSRSWLHLFPNPALDRCELPAAPSSSFAPVGRVPCIRAIVDLFGLEDGLGSVEISVFLGGEPRSPSCLSRIIVTIPTEISRLLISVKPRITDITLLQVLLFALTASAQVSDIPCSRCCWGTNI